MARRKTTGLEAFAQFDPQFDPLAVKGAGASKFAPKFLAQFAGGSEGKERLRKASIDIVASNKKLRAAGLESLKGQGIDTKGLSRFRLADAGLVSLGRQGDSFDFQGVSDQVFGKGDTFGAGRLDFFTRQSESGARAGARELQRKDEAFARGGSAAIRRVQRSAQQFQATEAQRPGQRARRRRTAPGLLSSEEFGPNRSTSLLG